MSFVFCCDCLRPDCEVRGCARIAEERRRAKDKWHGRTQDRLEPLRAHTAQRKPPRLECGGPALFGDGDDAA